MQEEHALTPGLLYLVVVYIVVDVSGAFKDQVAVETAGNYVFLEEGSAAIAHVDPISEGGSDLVEKYMGMRVAVNFYAYFLVESYQIILDFRLVSGSPDQKSSFFVLGKNIEADDRSALPILS